MYGTFIIIACSPLPSYSLLLLLHSSESLQRLASRLTVVYSPKWIMALAEPPRSHENEVPLKGYFHTSCPSLHERPPGDENEVLPGLFSRQCLERKFSEVRYPLATSKQRQR